MSEWFAFWILVAVFVVCECVVTLSGVDTLLWQFKTPAELAIQKRLGKVP